jgi:hypothetical protein
MLRNKSQVIEYFCRQLSQCWRGEKSLSATFWLVVFIGNIVFLAILGSLQKAEFNGAWLFAIFVLIYFVFSIKSLCSSFIAYERKRSLAIVSILFCIYVAIGLLGVGYNYSGDVVEVLQGEIIDKQWSAGKSGINLAIVKLDTGELVKAWCSHKKKGTKVTIEKRVSVFDKSSFEYACRGHFT